MVIAIMHWEDRSNQSDPFVFPLYPPSRWSSCGSQWGSEIFLPYRSFFLGSNLHLIWLAGPALNFEPWVVTWRQRFRIEDPTSVPVRHWGGGIIYGSILVLSSCVVTISAQGSLELKFWLISQPPCVLINIWCLRCIPQLRRWLSQ